MKNPIPYLILLMAILSACNHASKQPASEPAAPPKNHLPGYPNGSDVVQAYTQYLRSLDTLTLSNSQAALKEFDLRFTTQSPEVCDTGFMLFLDFQRTLNTQDSNIAKFVSHADMEHLFMIQNHERTANAQEQAAGQKLAANNFIITVEEGGYGPFIVPAWQPMADHFFHYVSKPMKEVLVRENMEQKKPFMGDDGVLVNPSELVHRTIGWERFLAGYPHHIYDSIARSNYNEMVHIMVEFATEMPLNDSTNTPTIAPFYDTVFHLIHDGFPGSHTDAVINPWWQALLAKDTVTMRKIRDSLPSH